MGKSSIVKKVRSEINDPAIKIVYMDIYDCRSEYDFYNRFASSLLRQTATRTEQIVENIKKFLVRLTPKIGFSMEPLSEISLSLGITPQNYQPEEILQLPEIIAGEQGIHIIVCIDEFQQIGELSDSLTVQKRLRGIWQHQRNVSYCLFGSKKHLMTKLFQNRKMPFYQFGEMIYLGKIPTEEWVNFICSRFESQGKHISKDLAQKICNTVENHSSYVQQLAWNVLAETDHETTEQDFERGVEALLAQCSGLFEQHIQGLTSYQLNFIRAIAAGYRKDFGKKEVTSRFNLGTRSNLEKLQKAIVEREIADYDETGYSLTDPLFEIWFKRQMM
jgi:primosomal protein N''